MDLDLKHHTPCVSADLASIVYYILPPLLHTTPTKLLPTNNSFMLGRSGNRLKWTIKSGILAYLSNNPSFVLSPKLTLCLREGPSHPLPAGSH